MGGGGGSAWTLTLGYKVGATCVLATRQDVVTE